MQFAAVQFLAKENTGFDGSLFATIPITMFHELLVAALHAGKNFDEQYYLEANADVRLAIERKQIDNAATHYYRTGYFENRLPKNILVDEDFYLKMNPDVAGAIKSGLVKSAQEHFQLAGFREGRLPYPGFSLFKKNAR